MIEDFYADINQLSAVMDEVRELENSLKFLTEKLVQKDEALFKNSWKDKINTIEKDLKTQKEKVAPKEVQGIYRQPAILLNQLFNISSYLYHTLSPPTDNQRLALQLFRKGVADFLKEFEDFKNGEMAEFKKEVEVLGMGILD